jgi:hypothetical protein
MTPEFQAYATIHPVSNQPFHPYNNNMTEMDLHSFEIVSASHLCFPSKQGDQPSFAILS